MLDDLLGERQVALALEALANLVDIQLRAVLRVAAVKELREPLNLIVDFFRAARGALPRPHAGSTPRADIKK